MGEEKEFTIPFSVTYFIHVFMWTISFIPYNGLRKIIAIILITWEIKRWCKFQNYLIWANDWWSSDSNPKPTPSSSPCSAPWCQCQQTLELETGKKKKKDLWGLMDRNNPHSLTTPSHHDVFFNDLTMVMRAFGGVDWVLNQSLLLSRRVTLNISNFPMYT